MLRYERSRHLATEIDKLRLNVFADLSHKENQEKVRSTELKDSEETIDGMRFAVQKDQRHRSHQEKNLGRLQAMKPSTSCAQRREDKSVCNMKGCYCREGELQTKQSATSTRATAAKSQQRKQSPEKRGPTWDEILGQNLDMPVKSNVSAKKDEYCQVDKRQVVKSSSSNGICEGCDQFCHPECFVEEIAVHQPGYLLELKQEVDKALKKMGLHNESNHPKRDVDGPKLVLQYLEELSLEMLKKRLEESESRYRNMRKKMEDALVAQKLEIQQLKSDLCTKNEECNKLKNFQDLNCATLASRELALVNRCEMLENRLTNMLEKEEKTLSQIHGYKKELANLKLQLNCAAKDRDLYQAKMEIYQTERDKAVASLSVYETTFKTLKCELGQEIRLIKPSPNMTADSCGTLDSTGHEPREIATSSPNVSSERNKRQHIQRNRISSTPLTKTKQPKANLDLTKVDEISLESFLSKDHNGRNYSKQDRTGRLSDEAMLRKLKCLAVEFRNFAEDVIPLAANLDQEANELLNVESSPSFLTETDMGSLPSVDSTTTLTS